MEIYNIDKATIGLKGRSEKREIIMMQSTTALISSFIEDGKTLEESQALVKELSGEIRNSSPGVKYDFKLGDTQPLKDSVQASVLIHMTQAKKDIVLNILNQTL